MVRGEPQRRRRALQRAEARRDRCDAAQPHWLARRDRRAETVGTVRLRGHHAHVVPPVPLQPQDDPAQQPAAADARDDRARLDPGVDKLVDEGGVALPQQRVLVRRDVFGVRLGRDHRTRELVGLVPVGAVHRHLRALRPDLVEHDRLGRCRHDHADRHPEHAAHGGDGVAGVAARAADEAADARLLQLRAHVRHPAVLERAARLVGLHLEQHPRADRLRERY
mmetsp:Transcript_4681/g.13860  ORF Transcript_4681/g.13860 Transcript_4681/m.13860 type:complete len:223 (+) Transcript_4681:430-1098(+)